MAGHFRYFVAGHLAVSHHHPPLVGAPVEMGDNSIQRGAESGLARPAVAQDYDQGAFVDLVPDMLKCGNLLPPVGKSQFFNGNRRGHGMSVEKVTGGCIRRK